MTKFIELQAQYIQKNHLDDAPYHYLKCPIADLTLKVSKSSTLDRESIFNLNINHDLTELENSTILRRQVVSYTL